MKEIKTMTEKELNDELRTIVADLSGDRAREILISIFIEEKLQEKRETVMFYRE